MADNTLTLSLEGDVPLTEFAAAVQHFTGLVNALSREIGAGTRIEWVIANLEGGSARATVEGISENLGIVDRVVLAYMEVGQALERGEPITRGPKVREEAEALTRVLNDHIKAIRFETARGVANISGRAGAESPGITYAFGAVEGIVETLSSRGQRLRFTLYDTIFDKAINCYLNKGQEEIVRGIWGKRVIVNGQVGRDPDHGRAIVIYDVEGIEQVEEVEPGSFERAGGILPWLPGSEFPEDIIRRSRDND